jgi:hypothetical protein
MEFLFAVAILTIVYFGIKKVRGPLPPKPPVSGGGTVTDDEKTGPVNEE